MTTPSVIRAEDAEGVCVRAAQEFLQLAEESVVARGRFTVALSGGSTPRALYQLLSAAPNRGRVDWSSVEFFWGDERSVPPDDKASNFRMANEAMLQTLAIPEAQIHRMEAEREDFDAAAMEYQETIARVLQVSAAGSPPAVDLVLLGMGPDGHTASLFPETKALDETTRWVVSNEVPQLNTRRMTLTVPMINAARSVIFLIAGEKKAGLLAEVLYGPSQPRQLPSQRIAPVSGRLTWLIDEAASRKLPAFISE
jgi:6-phosphogluconolactonase